jgi:CRP-like cAMP-binding protein
MLDRASAEELDEIALQLTPLSFKSGVAIVTQGEVADGMYLIDSGTAVVELGGEVVLEYGPGDYFGELGLLSETKNTRSATVRSTSPARCLWLSLEMFDKLACKREVDAALAQVPAA